MELHKYIWAITAKLFEADERRLTKTIDSLCRENKSIRRNSIDGFIFYGKKYIPSSGNIIIPDRGESMPVLDPSLHERMNFYLADRRGVDNEKTAISQMLFRLLTSCRDRQDFRDALPECLVGYDPNLRGLNRQRNAAWTLENDPRGKRQYEKLLPQIEAYSVAQLIF
jgi:hypothetical protein